jgi:hypothetical protein
MRATMNKENKQANPVVLRQGMTIGSISAETDDDFLFSCFISYPPLESCLRMQSHGMILAGRTGSGKTAILRYIKSVSEHSVEIDPSQMAMSYVSNSDALNFLHAIGADLDLLFQVLWKHVLCIEFIRMRWAVENEEKSRNVFARLLEKFIQDGRKKRSLEYLRAWEGKLWITIDQNIKEMTEKVDAQLKAELGAEIEKFKLGGQYEKRLSTEKKSELVARSRKIINAEQLAELSGVIEILAGPEAGDGMKHFYILIDNLDDRWVDTSVRFRLIRSLIESLKSFRKITNLKILVALRSDILERVVQETTDLTFQREKFEQYFVQIRWTKVDLRKLVDRRINVLVKRQYSGSDVFFDDVFRSNVGHQSAFDYILDRTLMRPRDVIAFVNECIKAADGSTEVTAHMMRRAEIEFSRIRKEAMVQEWQSAFPSLNKILNFVAARKAVACGFSDLCNNDRLDELALAICSAGKIDFDPVYNAAQSYFDSERNEACQLEFVREVVGILYRVGAVGIKLQANERFIYSHSDQPIIGLALMTVESRMRIHPMLHGAFRLKEVEA